MFIKTKIEKLIGSLIIDRPESLNAMNNKVLDELIMKVKELISDSEVRVIIISGAGDKAFIAGADIKLMQSMNKKEALDFAKKGQLLTSLIENSNKPVIAAVNGYAFGGGSELALSCHIRIATEDAIFSQPEVKIGLLPGWGGTQRLPRIIGKGIANEIILTGMNISADRAYEIGLVNKVVKKDDLISNCNKIAEAIIRNSPNAINESIKLINISSNLDLKAGLEIEAKRFSDLFNTDETSEGLTAFVQKRAPKY